METSYQDSLGASKVGMPTLESQNEVNQFLAQRGLPGLPIFSGINPRDWVRHIEGYFLINRSVEIFRDSMVADLLVGKAGEWYSSWNLDTVEVEWDEFVEALCTRFEDEALLEASEIENVEVGNLVPNEEVSAYTFLVAKAPGNEDGVAVADEVEDLVLVEEGCKPLREDVRANGNKEDRHGHIGRKVADLDSNVVSGEESEKLSCLRARRSELLREYKVGKLLFQNWDPGDFDIANKVGKLCLMADWVVKDGSNSSMDGSNVVEVFEKLKGLGCVSPIAAPPALFTGVGLIFIAAVGLRFGAPEAPQIGASLQNSCIWQQSSKTRLVIQESNFEVKSKPPDEIRATIEVKRIEYVFVDLVRENASDQLLPFKKLENLILNLSKQINAQFQAIWDRMDQYSQETNSKFQETNTKVEQLRMGICDLAFTVQPGQTSEVRSGSVEDSKGTLGASSHTPTDPPTTELVMMSLSRRIGNPYPKMRLYFPELSASSVLATSGAVVVRPILKEEILPSTYLVPVKLANAQAPELWRLNACEHGDWLIIKWGTAVHSSFWLEEFLEEISDRPFPRSSHNVFEEVLQSVPVGRVTPGCIIHVIGQPIDHRSDIKTKHFLSIHGEAPAFVEQANDQQFLVLGMEVVDLLLAWSQIGITLQLFIKLYGSFEVLQKVGQVSYKNIGLLIHGDGNYFGSCSCESLSLTWESSIHTSIASIVMLAAALQAVWDFVILNKLFTLEFPDMGFTKEVDDHKWEIDERHSAMKETLAAVEDEKLSMKMMQLGRITTPSTRSFRSSSSLISEFLGQEFSQGEPNVTC